MNFKKIIMGMGLVLFSLQFHAQNIDQSYTLNWHEPVHQKISDDYTISYLYFDDAFMLETEKRTPVFWNRFSLGNDDIVPAIFIQNQIWETLTEEELSLIDITLVKDTLNINIYVEYTQKVPALKVEFLPFRKNGDQYEKLISFHITDSSQAVFVQKSHKNRTYTNSSVLSNDGFYKIGITETGIHKITYEDFVSLGMSVSSLKIGNISVFGNGGRILPEYTSTAVFDDLQEVAIQIVDNNGNGYFDQSDYVLFYGVGVKNWKNEVDGLGAKYPFTHELNHYTNQTYYFITTNENVGQKKRVQSISSETASSNETVTSHSFHAVHEKDLVNVAKVGRIWFGEEFNTTTPQSFSFSIPGIINSERAYMRIQAAARSSATSNFAITVNNSSLSNFTFSSNEKGTHGKKVYDFIPTSETITVQLTYSKPNNNSVAWLDYIEIHARQTLAQHTGQFSFRNPEIVRSGEIAEYQFDTKGKNTRIWDVTDQHNVKLITAQQNGNTLTFRLTADSLREFLAFDGSSFYSVTPVGKVDRQDLHSASDLDFIIITHPNFMEAANKLAAFRRSNDNMRVGVFTTTQVYNEFSSGGCDIGAIRNFIKMFYDRETTDNMPKNVLLIGKTSYDPRNIDGKGTCFIPNYQGDDSIFKDQDCKSTDNFFVKLADGKGASNNGTMDMGLGRFPVYTNAQAMNLVTKSINYASYDDLTASNNNVVSNLGNWRNIVAFMADDNDKTGFHMGNAENICPIIVNGQPYLNIEKIYADAYKKESSSSGTRFTEATKAMNDRINKGCLMFTYFGHGGDKGWADERLLLRTDIYSWNNKYCLPFFYTACCSFAMYDKAEGTSPAEDMLLKTDGGAIALISSTRNSSPSTNENFGKGIYRRAFEKENNKYLTLGEIHAKAHTDVNGSHINMYVLLGDPSITLAHPKYNVVTDSINGISVSVYNDTIKALQHVTISGYIADYNGNKLDDYNGWLYPSVYDKLDSVSTINPDMETKRFPLQKSIIFKGKTKIENGKFSFSFLTPMDINYEYGLGKISYYATGNQIDAKGYTEILIGGMNDTIINDDRGPDIKLYFNDEKFKNGGITTSDPILYAKISDESGINTTGAGIGHDIVAIIDDDVANAIVLNDYFEYDANSYVSGLLNYALSTLDEGYHTLKLRAWDVINNMGEATIGFEVVSKEDLQITHVYNYPNPVTTSTQFVFEHNQPDVSLQIKIQIFTISGNLVKTIDQNQQNTGFRSEPIYWDGRNGSGGKLSQGIYVYKLQVTTSDGGSIEKIGKLAIL
jgi:hypothetical protein